MQRTIVYEQPLNERMRLFLRLDCLFRQTQHCSRQASVWDSRSAVSGLLDMLAFFTRMDVKSEVIKELERHAATLERWEAVPGIDTEQLRELLARVDGMLDQLYALKGQIGLGVRQSELLATVSKRSAIPGGTCEFDLPAYHHWLQRPAEDRMQALSGWVEEFAPIQRPIAFCLELTRESAVPTREVAPGGYLQRSLDPNGTWQLVMVSVPADLPYYPEISGGKHRFTVRFMKPGDSDRAAQAEEDVAFELACCNL